MEYKDFIADFARRTLQNLDVIQLRAIDGDGGVYPVTQLWNSLLGLIVLPRERDLRRIPQTPMTELWSEGWPRFRVSGSEHGTLRDLVSDLRNAVAHFNVAFLAGPDREITSVTVWTQRSDTQGRPIRDTRRWEGQITVDELDRLAKLIAHVYVKEFASTAA